MCSSDLEGLKKIQTNLEVLKRKNYSNNFNEGFGTYDLVCILHDVKFLNTNEFITYGNSDITVTGKCSYFDSENNIEEIKVALAVQNRNSRSTWVAGRNVSPYMISPTQIEQFFQENTDVASGSIIVVGFGLPNAINANVQPQGNNDEIILSLYSEDDIELFNQFGNPEDLSGIIVPMTVTKVKITD